MSTPTIAVDSQYGFRHLDPVPRPAELDGFYAAEYMELVEAGGRAPEIRRLLSGGPERAAELGWLRATLYADVELALRDGGPARLLDVGCGTGDFLGFAVEQGWTAEGVEPSHLASQKARELGFTATTATLEEFCEARRGESWEAVSLLNVLEHVPDPRAYVRHCRSLLSPGGRLAVVVPNDFSEVQAAAGRALGTDRRWWVAAPDHINYFDFESIQRLLRGEGFEIVERSGTFPMELFLMMGEDYLAGAEVGQRCHERRRRLESALPSELRRRLYRSLAREGLGRNCLMVARRTP